MCEKNSRQLLAPGYHFFNFPLSIIVPAGAASVCRVAVWPWEAQPSAARHTAGPKAVLPSAVRHTAALPVAAVRHVAVRGQPALAEAQVAARMPVQRSALEPPLE